MGKSPAVVIVARHGARLDIEDKTWHLTSPTPYDPPLSYGGWIQSRALGARIASLLHARDLAAVSHSDAEPKPRGSTAEPDDSQTREGGRKSKPQKLPIRKIVVHSSPFLRCIQSSIAISSGMLQYQANLGKFGQGPPRSTSSTPGLYTPPTRSRTLDSKALELSITQKLEQTRLSQSSTGPPDHLRFTNVLLRVDAWLGEWLSPDYYDFITAPPPSKMMIAAAKADLLRAGEPIQGARMASSAQDVRHSDENTEKKDFSSNGSETAANSTAESGGFSKLAPKIGGYEPPIPQYALSPSQPIPKGYVEHARNLCLDIDFQWDSMRPPLGWGDGGQYGEEWSSMHKRFRKGLTKLISWYRRHGAGKFPYPDPSKVGTPDDESEVVLIIVTHGAGCNALIGGLTNQPVLLDVGMGSLTMAVRNDKTSSVSNEDIEDNAVGRRRPPVDPGLSQEYDMKLIASVEHLRAGVDPLKIPQLQAPRGLSPLPEHHRLAGGTPLSSGASTPPDAAPDPARSKNSALGSIRRSTVTNAVLGRTFSIDPIYKSHSSTGLWESKSQASQASDDTTANTGNSAGVSSKSSDENIRLADSRPGEQSAAAAAAAAAPSSVLGMPQGGPSLWSSSRASDRPERAGGSKRRWTVKEG